MTARVIHTGQAIVDLVMRVSALPPRGGDVFATDHRFFAGGGFNVIAAAARQAVSVEYAGGHGEGPFGDLIRSAMLAEGVRLTSPPITGIDTGFCVAVVDDGAERTFLSTVGAEGTIGRPEYAAANPTANDVLYVSGYSLLHKGTGEALAEWLPSVAATSVVFDASPVIVDIPEQSLVPTLEATTHLTLNRREAELLIGRLEAQQLPRDAEECAAWLASSLGCNVVVRDGSRGCVLATRGGLVRVVPAIQVEAVDMNGAGDAHTGVLCAELLRGTDLERAVERATVAASVAVTRHGPATAPTRDELDQTMQHLMLRINRHS